MSPANFHQTTHALYDIIISLAKAALGEYKRATIVKADNGDMLILFLAMGMLQYMAYHI